tara:strand:- start:2357 stop:2839 length:483 start_codon:yes stop_codon:yes gene_type:complete
LTFLLYLLGIVFCLALAYPLSLLIAVIEKIFFAVIGVSIGVLLVFSPLLLVVTFPLGLLYISTPSLSDTFGFYMILLSLSLPFYPYFGLLIVHFGLDSFDQHGAYTAPINGILFSLLYTLGDVSGGALIFGGIICLLGTLGGYLLSKDTALLEYEYEFVG